MFLMTLALRLGLHLITLNSELDVTTPELCVRIEYSWQGEDAIM